MKKLLPFYLLIVILSCQSRKDKVTEVALSQTFENERNSFFSHMKSAQTAAAVLQATAADFNGSLLSDPSNYIHYVSDTLKSASNLGIYLSDLNYCVAYKQSRYAKKSFNAAVELSKVIGVDRNVTEFLMTRYDKNITQNDSLMNVINDLYERSTSLLRKASKERLLGITMAAYQIETLHLALGVIETYPKDMLPEDSRNQILIPLFRMVLEQQKNIETIYDFLRTLEDANRGPNYFYYDQAFDELIAVYQRLNIDDAIANNRGIELMNDEVVSELSEKIHAIRSKVVDPGF